MERGSIVQYSGLALSSSIYYANTELAAFASSSSPVARSVHFSCANQQPCQTHALWHVLNTQWHFW